MPGIPELAVGAAARPELANKAAVGAEHLHAVVARVGDGEHVARRRPYCRQGIPELAVGAAARPELANKAAVGAEHLHAVVARVGDGEHAGSRLGRRRQRRKGNGTRVVKMAWLPAAHAHVVDGHAVGV